MLPNASLSVAKVASPCSMSRGQNFSPPRDLEALLSKKCKAESKFHDVLCLLAYQSDITLHLIVHGLQSLEEGRKGTFLET